MIVFNKTNKDIFISSIEKPHPDSIYTYPKETYIGPGQGIDLSILGLLTEEETKLTLEENEQPNPADQKDSNT